jgi:hypothetical protein
VTEEAIGLDEEDSANGSVKSGNAALDHAWAWFKYHAQQRVATMRFYIVAIGGAIAGVGILNHDEQHFLCACLSLLSSLMVFCFLRMDGRAGELVKAAERALSVEQGKLAISAGNEYLTICARVENPARSWPGTFGAVVRLLLSVIIIAFVGMAVYCIARSAHMDMLLHSLW